MFARHFNFNYEHTVQFTLTLSSLPSVSENARVHIIILRHVGQTICQVINCFESRSEICIWPKYPKGPPQTAVVHTMSKVKNDRRFVPARVCLNSAD